MNDTGGSAFPQEKVYVCGNQQTISIGPQGGMSLRDYFAAKAMQAMISNPNCPIPYRDVCDKCYEIADEMLDARKS